MGSFFYADGSSFYADGSFFYAEGFYFYASIKQDGAHEPECKHVQKATYVQMTLL